MQAEAHQAELDRAKASLDIMRARHRKLELECQRLEEQTVPRDELVRVCTAFAVASRSLDEELVEGAPNQLVGLTAAAIRQKLRDWYDHKCRTLRDLGVVPAPPPTVPAPAVGKNPVKRKAAVKRHRTKR